jgi:hypothetical protein
MREMIKNKSEDHVAGPTNIARRKPGLNPGFDAIRLAAARTPAFQRQRRSRPDVKAHAHQQPDSNQPQYRPERLEKMGVAVDLVRVRKDLEISD